MSTPANNAESKLEQDKKIQKENKKNLTFWLNEINYKYSENRIPLEIKLNLLRAIKENQYCDHLSLVDIALIPQDFIDIFEALKENSKIVTLNFRKIELSTSTEAYPPEMLEQLQKDMVKLAQTMAEMPHVTSLNFEECNIDSETLKWLNYVLSKNTTLKHLSFCPPTALEIANRIFNLSILEALKNHPSIESLSFQHYSFDTNFFHALTTLLRHNKNLQSLKVNFLCGDKIISEVAQIQFFQALGGNKSLRILELYQHHFSSDVSKALASALKVNDTLTELSLAGCRGICFKIRTLCESLTYNTSLKKLDLSENAKSQTGEAEDYDEDPKDDSFRAFADYLPRSSLVELNLIDCELTNDTAEKIIQGFAANNQELETLQLASPEFNEVPAPYWQLVWRRKPKLFAQYEAAIETNKSNRIKRIQEEWLSFENVLSEFLPRQLKGLIWQYYKVNTDFSIKAIEAIKAQVGIKEVTGTEATEGNKAQAVESNKAQAGESHNVINVPEGPEAMMVNNAIAEMKKKIQKI